MIFRLATEEDKDRIDSCIRSEWPDAEIGLVPNARTLIFEHGFISFGITHDIFPTIQHFYVDPEKRQTGEARKMLFAFLDMMSAFSFAKVILILPKTMDTLANKIMQEFDILPYDMSDKNWYLLIPTEEQKNA